MLLRCQLKVVRMMLLRLQLKVVVYSLHINIIVNDVAMVLDEGCGLFTEHKYH